MREVGSYDYSPQREGHGAAHDETGNVAGAEQAIGGRAEKPLAEWSNPVRAQDDQVGSDLTGAIPDRAVARCEQHAGTFDHPLRAGTPHLLRDPVAGVATTIARGPNPQGHPLDTISPGA